MDDCVYMGTSNLEEIKREKIINQIERELGMSIPVGEIIPDDLTKMVNMMKERVSSIRLEGRDLERKISLLEQLLMSMKKCRSNRVGGRGKRKTRHRKKHQKKRTKRHH